MSKKNSKITASREHCHHLLQQMLLIRRFEEKCAELYSATKIRGFLHLYIGEEAVATGIIENLQPVDAIVATYREHGHALARGIHPGKIMAEMYGKQEGCSRGRGGSMHLFDRDTHFYGGNAIVGGHLPMAAGLAMADKMLKKKQVTCCFFGEGAVTEGEFHESMNLAALWNLPVLFLCENNGYAMGTAIKRAESETDLVQKAASYNVESDSVDGMDVFAVEKRSKEAIEFVREEQKPFFLECRTYRFKAHSMFDAELYRSKEEVESWKKRCPIATLIYQLKSQELLDNKELEKIEQQVANIVQEAVAFAEAGTWEPIEELTRFVYSE